MRNNLFDLTNRCSFGGIIVCLLNFNENIKYEYASALTHTNAVDFDIIYFRFFSICIVFKRALCFILARICRCTT